MSGPAPRSSWRWRATWVSVSSRTPATPASPHAITIGPSSNRPTVPSTSRIAISTPSPITTSANRAGVPVQSGSARRRTAAAARAIPPTTMTSAATPSAYRATLATRGGGRARATAPGRSAGDHDIARTSRSGRRSLRALLRPPRSSLCRSPGPISGVTSRRRSGQRSAPPAAGLAATGRARDARRGRALACGRSRSRSRFHRARTSPEAREGCPRRRRSPTAPPASPLAAPGPKRGARLR